MGIIYKITSLLVGLASLFMGYRLFFIGIEKSAGDLDVQHGKWKFGLRGAAPGTFFALLGCAIVLATIWKGVGITKEKETQRLNEYEYRGVDPPIFEGIEPTYFFSKNELLSLGNEAYSNNDCINAVKYLFAYKVNGGDNDVSYLIRTCEQRLSSAIDKSKEIHTFYGAWPEFEEMPTEERGNSEKQKDRKR